MLAGVAAIDFTPKPGLVLQGHLSRNPSHTVLYPLEARALVLKNDSTTVCLITLDVIGVELKLAKEIGREVGSKLGIPANHVVIIASHTHCAPAMLHNLAMTPDPAFVQSIRNAAVKCAIDAAQQMERVTIGIGSSAAHFNVNRRPLPGVTGFSVNWGGVVDHRVRLLRLDRSNGTPLAILFSFSCHPTTKPGNEGFISPDYPGISRGMIERELKCRAVFLPGCFGNIRPHINGVFTPATKEQLENVSSQLASAAVRGSKYIATKETDFLAARETDLVLPFGKPKPTEDLEKMTLDQSTLGATVRADWAKRTLDKIKSASLPRDIRSVMEHIRIGPLSIITIPGEPVQEIGYAIERELPRSTDCDEVWAIGYTNDQIGYLVTERHKEEGGYEPNAYSFYDRPAGYRDEQQAIVQTAAKLCLSER